MHMPINGTPAHNLPPLLEGLPPGQTEAPDGAATRAREVGFDQMTQAHAQTLGKPAANVGLPAPGSITLHPTTLANLGALNDDQVAADIYTCMALFQKLAQQMRDTARTQRTANMQAQVGSLQAAAEQMKEAAHSRFTAAAIQGAAQIAGGVLQMGFSAASARSTIKGIKETADGRNKLNEARQGGGTKEAAQDLRKSGKEKMQEGDISQAIGAKYQGYAQGGSGIVSGLGSMVSAGFTLEADLADARRSELETQAKVFETGVQHANDAMQQMMDVIRDVRDKLQSIQQSALETNRSITRNI